MSRSYSLIDQKLLCPVCGKGVLEPRLRAESFEYGEGDDAITVQAENVPVRVCSQCQEVFSGPDAERVRHRAICRALNLLSPEEIRALRERLGLSQADFAALTGIGEATISRWERGRLIQNVANDRYLRLLQDERNLQRLRALETARMELEVFVFRDRRTEEFRTKPRLFVLQQAS